MCVIPHVFITSFFISGRLCHFYIHLYGVQHCMSCMTENLKDRFVEGFFFKYTDTDTDTDTGLQRRLQI